MCEKLLCCFMLPVGTIALAGISTWQNPLISPHKTTSYIPQGYYSNSVTLISLYIVLLPLQSCLIYSAWLCISVQSLSRQNIHVWNTTECVSMPTLCTYLLHCRGKKTPSEQQYWIFFFFFPHHGLNQVVGGFPPARCLFRPSICPSVDHLNRQTAQFQKRQEAPLVCNLSKRYSLLTNRLDM